MTYSVLSELEVLQLRQSLFELKITEEKVAIHSGGRGPGKPKECPHVPGESRVDRLRRWEATARALRRVIPSNRPQWNDTTTHSDHGGSTRETQVSLNQMENDVIPCRICADLNRFLQSALYPEAPDPLSGLTEAGQRNWVHQRREKILRAETDLERHRSSDRCDQTSSEKQTVNS
jgi:hypothetical protein